MSTQPSTLPVSPDTTRPAWSRKSIVKSLTISVAVLVLCFGIIFWRSINRYASDTWHCLTTECNPTGPAASWQDQFAAAEAAAHKLDPDAILTNILVHPAAYYKKTWQPNDALEITFNYVTVHGDLTVSLWDTAPSNVHTRQYDSSAPSYHRDTVERKTDIDTSLARIQVSPRQALERTQAAKEMEQLQGKDAYPSVILLLEFYDLIPLDLQKWNVTYRPVQNNNVVYTNADFVLTFTVDTASGESLNITR